MDPLNLDPGRFSSTPFGDVRDSFPYLNHRLKVYSYHPPLTIQQQEDRLMQMFLIFHPLNIYLI